MSGLLGSLSVATNALSAQRLGLDIAGQNIANVNTDGYARRRLLLADLPAVDYRSAGRGVDILGVIADRDQFIETRLRQEYQGAGYQQAVVDHLSQLETVFGLPGASIDQEFTAFFDAFAALADDPTSAVLRDGVVRQGAELSGAFQLLTERLTASRQAINTEVGAAVTEINVLSQRLARLNSQILQNGPDVQSLIDERARTLGALSDLADVHVIRRGDGGIDVALTSGHALVTGSEARALTLVPDGSGTGVHDIRLGDATVTGGFAAGRLGGLLHVRDTIVPGYQTALDTLAFDVATGVNALHAAGFDAAGVAGGDFFTVPATAAGAAGAIVVSAAIASDSSLVAASGTGAPGDNGAARAIAALRETRAFDGNTATPADLWARFVFTVGSDLSGASAARTSHDKVVRQLEVMQSQASGVSLDEEAANLMRYQRAYEANARYFTTIVDTLDVLMNMVR